MSCVVELLDVDLLALELDDRTFVVVHITVVRSTEDRDHLGKATLGAPLMHLIPFQLCLMSSNNAQQTVLFEELVDCI